MSTVSRKPRRPAELQWLPALAHPEQALSWPLPEWSTAVRSARRLRLLARLAEQLSSAGLMDRVDERPRRHLLAEQQVSRWRTDRLRWIVDRVGTTLASKPYPVVLLKGAAYVAQGLPIGLGRLPSDVDLLVPKAHLDDAVASLAAAGWVEQELDTHDQRYYREWSHELPPMHHPLHPLEVDLHHNIVPPVGSTRVDAEKFLQRVVAVTQSPWTVLDPVDQILHSAVHLFNDSELRDRIRDLADLDYLLRTVVESQARWPALEARARELGLLQSLALALHFCWTWFDTPVPEGMAPRLIRETVDPFSRRWLLSALESVLPPTSLDNTESRGREWAARALLARHHFRRMPLKLLLPHLLHKWRADKGFVERPGGAA